MSDDPILAAIARLGTDMMGRLERIEAVLNAMAGRDLVASHTRKVDHTREELRSLSDLVALIQGVQLKRGTRSDELERRLPHG